MREREPQLLAAELQPVQRVVRERVSARGGCARDERHEDERDRRDARECRERTSEQRAGGADALAQRRAERSVELPHDARAERLAPFPVERATDAADVHRDTHERADLLIRHQRQTPREELVQSAVELPVAVQSTLPSPPTEQAAACLTGVTRSLFRPDVSSAPSAGFRQSRSWSRTSRRSAWTMIRASSLSRTVGVQPSRSRAFVASPTSTSTSAGRKNFSETSSTSLCSPCAMRATACVIFRLTNSVPRRGDSWLKAMPPQVNRPYDSR